jgi:hypothetical protein
MKATSITESNLDPLAVSRREVMGLVEGWQRSINRVPDSLASLDPRKRAILHAAARALVLRHPRPWISPGSVLPFWSGPGRLPTPSQMEGIARQARALVPHLDDLDDEAAPYSGGFWYGLRLAGALVVHGAHLRLQLGRPWLAEDLERLPFPGKLSPADAQGRRWLIRCSAWRLPVANNLGVDVLAGLLAGAIQEVHDKRVWLRVPRTESVSRVLDWWSVSRRLESNNWLISPFYGVLVSGWMPAASASAMLVHRAGGCPLLSIAIWEAAFGAIRVRNLYLLPDRGGALPFICSDATRKRCSWTRDFLHRAATILGVAHVTPEMHQLLQTWRARNGTRAADLF